MEQWLSNNIGVVLTVAGFLVSLVAWAVRVESRTSQNHADIRDIEKRMVTHDSRISSLDTLKNDIEWIKQTLQRLLDKLDK